MTKLNRLLIAGLSFLLLQTTVHAQNKMPVKFGKISPLDFNVTVSGLDSAAGAIVIADFGTSSFEGNMQGWFSINFKHSCRIKILKREAFTAATISIPLLNVGRETETLESLRASTYNLEDGKVVETKLDDKSVYSSQLDKNHSLKKFSFPALKEGSIIEYTYTHVSPFLFNLQPWSFQSEYPCLWSEYQVDMPRFFEYVTLGHGFVPFAVNTTESRLVNFRLTFPGSSRISQPYSFSDDVVTHRWVVKNAPALKAEPFTTSVENYMARLEFQLARYSFSNGYSQDIMGNWVSVSNKLLESETFGADLDKGNGWMGNELAPITKGAGTKLEMAQKIYAFVRDNFNCTSHRQLYMGNNLKTVYKNRNGSEAEINLLLAAMLIHAKIATDPVILSTRDNGFANEVYPLLTRFNYVICEATIDTAQYYLDASEPWLAFGRLPERCFNGYARVLNKENPSAVSFDADLVKESKVSTVFLNNDEKGTITGRLQVTPGYNEACTIRQKIKTSGRQEFMKSIQAAYTGDVAVSDVEIDSVQNPDDPLGVAYDMKITPEPNQDIFYFNPMLGEGYKANPFKAAERKYPVEMPSAMDETFIMNMEIPAGYVVDELPKSAKVSLNTDQGFFEYLITKQDDNILLRSRIKLNQANFKPEDYATLRDFFGFIVNKQSEQIVFKKKKA